MRNIIYAINLTIDGCCDHTKQIANDEVHEYFTQLLKQVGVLLYGRKTYELMVPFWPDMAKTQSSQKKAMNDFALAFDAVGKIVVCSRSLNRAEEEKTSIIHTRLRDEILKLKQQPGKDILTGGVDIPSQLIQLGLVDEFRFIVNPLIAGDGRRLMEDVNLPEKLQLKLVDSKVFESGGVLLRYMKG
jgi:dihydrofolate reductase